MHDLKFGVVLGDLTMSASECIRLGPKVENWGYNSIWMADHLIDIDGAVADPYAVFGYLAARTQNIFFCAAVSDCQTAADCTPTRPDATVSEVGRLCDDEIFFGPAAIGCMLRPSGAGETEIRDRR